MISQCLITHSTASRQPFPDQRFPDQLLVRPTAAAIAARLVLV
jgi:hypothetical protein